MESRQLSAVGVARRAALVVSLSSCGLLAPIEDVNREDGSTVPTPCTSLPRSKVMSVVAGSGHDWTAVLVPLAVTRDAVYMDKTEVTVREYQPWVDANADSFTPWHEWCQWKKAGPSNPARSRDDACVLEIPGNQPEPFASEKPMRCIDWCDAQAFCQSARGGRLCYRLAFGGSALPEHTAEEWPSACSNGGTTAWPWGDKTDDSICNVGQQRACGSVNFSCGPARVGSFTACRNSTEHVDLIGNVAEWLGVCAARDVETAGASCVTAGGSYDDDLRQIDCVGSPGLPKSGRSPRVGFRCCYDLTPQERVACGRH